MTRKLIIAVLTLFWSGTLAAIDLPKPALPEKKIHQAAPAEEGSRSARSQRPGLIPEGHLGDLKSTAVSPYPENCHVKEMKGTRPDVADAHCERFVCDGYFWGKSAFDHCETKETYLLGEGAESEVWNVVYLRFPLFVESSDPFLRTIVPPAGGTAAFFKCGTGLMTATEWDKRVWGIPAGSKAKSQLFSLFDEIFLWPEAWAERAFGEGDPVPTGLWLDVRKWKAAGQFLDAYGRIEANKNAGLYGAGAEGTEQRALVDIALMYLGTAGCTLDPAVCSVAGGQAVRDIPKIHWARMPTNPDGTPWYIGLQDGYDIYIDESLKGAENETEANAVLIHELSHFFNASTGRGLSRSGLSDQLGMWEEEWIAHMVETLFVTNLSESAKSGLSDARQDSASTLHDLFLSSPAGSRTWLGKKRPDLIVDYLPDDFLREAARAIGEFDYEAFFPECRAEGPNCPPRGDPSKWPQGKRDELNSLTRSVLYEEHELIARQNAWLSFDYSVNHKGLLGLESQTQKPVPVEATVIPGRPFRHALQLDNWLHGKTGGPPWNPTFVPGELGIGPEAGYDPTGNEGRPKGLLGSKENDPSWKEPPKAGGGLWGGLFGSGDVEVPEGVRGSSPERTSPSSCRCPDDEKPIDWCWKHVDWDERKNAGPCRETMKCDVDMLCCTGNSDCKEVRRQQREETRTSQGATSTSGRTGCDYAGTHDGIVFYQCPCNSSVAGTDRTLCNERCICEGRGSGGGTGAGGDSYGGTSDTGSGDGGGGSPGSGSGSGDEGSGGGAKGCQDWGGQYDSCGNCIRNCLVETGSGGGMGTGSSGGSSGGSGESDCDPDGWLDCGAFLTDGNEDGIVDACAVLLCPECSGCGGSGCQYFRFSCDE